MQPTEEYLSDNQFIGFTCSEIQNTEHSVFVTQIDLGGIFLPMIRHVENIVTPHSLKKLPDKCTCHKGILVFDAQQIGEDRIAFELVQIRITVFINGCLEVITWVFEVSTIVLTKTDIEAQTEEDIQRFHKPICPGCGLGV
jgi:hypothetical protein